MCIRPLLATKNYLCKSVKSVGDKREEAGRTSKYPLQGDDLTMLNFIPDVPSDYSGLHPADALSLVSDARRLGLHAYIFASSGSATALVGVFATRGILSGIRVGIRGGAIP